MLFKCGIVIGKKHENLQRTQMSRCFSLNAMHSCTEYVLAHICAFTYQYSVSFHFLLYFLTQCTFVVSKNKTKKTQSHLSSMSYKVKITHNFHMTNDVSTVKCKITVITVVCSKTLVFFCLNPLVGFIKLNYAGHTWKIEAHSSAIIMRNAIRQKL